MIKDKEIAIPGETIAEDMGLVPSRGIYREGNKLIAERLGMVTFEGKVVKLIPLSGVYIPKIGDKIIVKVTDILMTGWRVDTRSPYSAVMPLRDATSEFIPRTADLSQFLAIGDYAVVKITNVTSQKLIDVTMKAPGLHRLNGGRIINVNTHKVPRIIGREGSMVMMIKDSTGCNISIGQNGVIWLSGTPEQELKAIDAIKKIESESHISGLTERMEKYLGVKSRGAMPSHESGEHESTAPRTEFVPSSKALESDDDGSPAPKELKDDDVAQEKPKRRRSKGE